MSKFGIDEHKTMVYVEHGLPMQTFEDALAESYLIVENVFYNLKKFPSDYQTYSNHMNKYVKNKFKKIDKQIREANADLNFDADMIVRDTKNITTDRQFLAPEPAYE